MAKISIQDSPNNKLSQIDTPEIEGQIDRFEEAEAALTALQKASKNNPSKNLSVFLEDDRCYDEKLLR